MMSPFEHIEPTPAQRVRLDFLAGALEECRRAIHNHVPASPYRSQALTCLEIAGVMAGKGVTHGDTTSQERG